MSLKIFEQLDEIFGTGEAILPTLIVRFSFTLEKFQSRGFCSDD